MMSPFNHAIKLVKTMFMISYIYSMKAIIFIAFKDSKFEKDCLIQSTKGQGKLALDVRMIVEDLKQAISK